jgi:ER lumen protein retaining receptor
MNLFRLGELTDLPGQHRRPCSELNLMSWWAGDDAAGDMTHLLSIVTLLLKIHATKSCAGVSMRTQELYALVFVTRYLDLFFNFISFYNTCMKLIFVSSSFTILWYMRRHKVVSQTYDKEQVHQGCLFCSPPSLLTTV